MVLRFISHLSTQHLSPNTIRVYLSSVRAWTISSGAPAPDMYTPRVKWAIKAIQRAAPPPKAVPPFTFSMLSRIINFIPPTYDSIMSFTSMLLAYFGCMRAAEYCPNPRVAPPITPIDVNFTRQPHLTCTVKVKSSKNSIHGCSVVIGCSKKPVCAPCWLHYLLSITIHPPSSPIFLYYSGEPLNPRDLTSFMRQTLRAAGLPPLAVTPHSLRAGSATDAAGLGLQDSAIQSLGRWRSGAFARYIRPSPAHQASNAALLASSQLHPHI